MVAEAMRQTNLSELLGFVSRLERKATSRPSTIGLFWGIIRIAYYQSQMNRMSDSALREINASLKTCTFDCAHHGKCMDSLIGDATAMVERLDKLTAIYDHFPKLGLIGKRTAALADRWHALLEELYIRTSSDRFKDYLFAAQEASSPEEVDEIRAAFAAEEWISREGTLSHDEMKRRLSQ